MPLRDLYRQDAYSIFQNRMYDSVQAARDCPRGDIRLVEDMETDLVRNAAFRPDLMHYDAAYQDEQALSPDFMRHLDGVADLVERMMGRERLVEVGCGRGTFPALLLARGVDISGFDPPHGERPGKAAGTPRGPAKRALVRRDACRYHLPAGMIGYRGYPSDRARRRREDGGDGVARESAQGEIA